MCFDLCAQWHTYASLLGISSPSAGIAEGGVLSLATWVNFVFYVARSIGMAVLAAVFVKVFAPYACGSGIGEVRSTVLCCTVLYEFVKRAWHRLQVQVHVRVYVDSSCARVFTSSSM